MLCIIATGLDVCYPKPISETVIFGGVGDGWVGSHVFVLRINLLVVTSNGANVVTLVYLTVTNWIRLVK